MGTYLNLPSTRAMLGVDAAKPKWEGCNATVGEAFVASGDDVGKTWLYVTQLLERGVYVLNYVGTLDWSK
jgi:cathepsin A (carboxypeptidase C)